MLLNIFVPSSSVVVVITELVVVLEPTLLVANTPM